MSTQPRVDLLVNTGPTPLDQQWDVNGTPGDVGDLTFEVRTADGAVQASGATTKTGTGASTLYSFDLANQTELTRLKLTYAKALAPTVKLVHYIEVFGSQLFTERDARGSQITGQQEPFADEGDFPDSEIARWRLLIGDKFESKTGRSWVRRYCRTAVAGTGTPFLRPMRGRARDWEGRGIAGEGRHRDIIRVVSAEISGDPIDPTEIVCDGGQLIYKSGIWTSRSWNDPLNILVSYEYGVDPPDSEAHEHAISMLHANALPSNISSAAEGFQNDAGNLRVTENGWVYPSPVWEWLSRNNGKLLMA